MSGNRPSLADAFAPSMARGAKLEGMLAPKRRKVNDQPADPSTVRPPHVALVEEPQTNSAPVTSLSKITDLDNAGHSGGVVDTVDHKRATRTTPSAPSEPQRATKKAAASSPKKASQTVAGAPRNVGVYLEPELLANVKETVHLQRTTYADLLLDAFDALDEDVIADEFKTEVVPSPSGMPRRTVRKRGAAGIQIQVRLDDDQIAWLDTKVVEFDAPSRSALVSAAYKLFLTRR